MPMEYRETAAQAQARIQAEKADLAYVKAEQEWLAAENAWEKEARELPSHAKAKELWRAKEYALRQLERANRVSLIAGTITLVEGEVA